MTLGTLSRLFGLVAEVTAVQTIGTMAVMIIPALAPEIASTVGVAAASVGYQISALYVAGLFTSFVAGSVVAWLGPCRSSQATMVLTSIGCLTASVPHVATLAAGSLVIGAAYGLLNPASSDLLVRHVPVKRRNLIFSIKQMGVPLGGILAGLVGPPVALVFGWPAALWCVALACAAVAVSLQPFRVEWDAHVAASGRASRLAIVNPLSLLRSSALRCLALASFCFAAIQMSTVTFMSVLLVDEIGLDLVAAGAILAAAQACGAVGRILWGAWADRTGDGLVALLTLALQMAVCTAMAVLLTPAWPVALIALVFMLLGASVVGWTGLYLSEMARIAPAGVVSAFTGAGMSFTFLGVVVGPTLFSLMYRATGSYARSYVLLVVLAAVAALSLWAARRQNRP